MNHPTVTTAWETPSILPISKLASAQANPGGSWYDFVSSSATAPAS